MPKLPAKLDAPASASFARDTASYMFTEDRFSGTASDAAKLAALLAQFQARYPNASLVAELLLMHENQFVVRALVQIGGAALVSGMAAATDIEQAEDRAKLRALETLSIQPAIAPRPDLPAMQSGYELQLRVSTPEAIEPAETPVFAEPPLPEPLPAMPADFSLTLPAIEALTEPIDRAAKSAPLEPAPIEVAGVPDLPLPSWEPEPEPSEPEPIDMSDAIARTTVELKRLGWTNVKGREHLEKTYSKRSRQQLTDSELLDFLRFLEGQPSPGQSPF